MPKMFGMTATLSVVSDAAGVELGGFRLGYVAADGTQYGLCDRAGLVAEGPEEGWFGSA
jgi:hypothetical protein